MPAYVPARRGSQQHLDPTNRPGRCAVGTRLVNNPSTFLQMLVVARRNCPVVPHAVAVLHRSREHIGNRLDPAVRMPREPRSEEHTSELQSRLHLVCRLLLEKKNTLIDE